NWTYSFDLDGDLVWDAFFLHALVCESTEQGSKLWLSNQGSHSNHIENALHDHNAAMAGPGQEQWNHACDLCCAVETVDGSEAYMRAVVMDGVTIGHPCCGVYDCQEPLPNQRAHFCGSHTSEADLCTVTSCQMKADAGHKTCDNPGHRALETTGSDEHSAMFQLQKQLERSKAVHLVDSVGRGTGSTPGEDEVVEFDETGECTGKPDTGNSKPHARFGWRCTHNEQLCVGTCGVVLGRATFYGSEGVSGCRVDILCCLFPTPLSLPQFIFFNNSCSLKKHLQNIQDHYFDHIAMPVDIFHMKSKHKESDLFCGQHCNPASWPALIKNGKWRFNSSTAEMTNAWFGGFQAIVREMREDRYNFFLDEMVKLHNRMVVANLANRKAYPYQIP
ncbi:hypothetical protein JAAARDRAFT_133990, partial [Jaapia argillacea MUCL 33604]